MGAAITAPINNATPVMSCALPTTWRMTASAPAMSPCSKKCGPTTNTTTAAFSSGRQRWCCRAINSGIRNTTYVQWWVTAIGDASRAAGHPVVAGRVGGAWASGQRLGCGMGTTNTPSTIARISMFPALGHPLRPPGLWVVRQAARMVGRMRR